MGISVKTAGFTIGGLAALWLVNKSLNMLGRTIETIAEAGKWKAYYKYGEHEHAVPPGYARYGDWRSPEQQEEDNREKAAEERQARNKDSRIDMKPIGESLETIAKAYFKTKGIDLDRPENAPIHCSYRHQYDDTIKYEEKKQDIADTPEIPKVVVDNAPDELPRDEENIDIPQETEETDE